MAVAYIEHLPHATSEHEATSHYVMIVNGIEVHGNLSTQLAEKTKACNKRYRTLHVARQRHLQDKAPPAHWRSDTC